MAYCEITHFRFLIVYLHLGQQMSLNNENLNVNHLVIYGSVDWPTKVLLVKGKHIA